ncbi:hypothetical protein HDV05_001888, partial [Chytridiales sp. JEL 0842]
MPAKEDVEVAADAAPVVIQRPKGPRPDKAAHEKEVKAANAEIDRLKAEMAALQQKIGGTDNIKDQYDGRRKELRAQLDELSKERTAVNEARGKLLDKIKSIQTGMKKKNEDLKSSKDKLGVKNVEELDLQVSRLEAQLTAGSLKLIEEKRVVTEISNLKKARKVLENLSGEANSFKNDKEQLDQLRAELDTLQPKKDEINKQFDKVKAELNKVDGEKRKDLGSFNELISQKKDLKAKLDAEYDKVRTLRSDFRKLNDEWFQWERAEKERKQKEYLALKKQADAERLAKAAQRELEDADIPAFTEEINTCN